MTYDYSEFESEELVGDNLMTSIQELAQNQLDAETRIENLEEQLTEAKAALRIIRETDIPNLFEQAELGDSKITTPVGHEVSVSEEIRGSIPKKNEVKAFKWFEDTDNGNIVKRVFTIEFGKGDEKWADKFEKDCARRKKPLNLKRKKSVHKNTLQAFVRSKLAEGEELPLDILGVFRQRVSKVKVK